METMEWQCSKTHDEFGTEWRLGYNDMQRLWNWNTLGRYIGKMQWLMPFIGFDYRYRKMGMDEEENYSDKNKKDTELL